MCSIVWGYFCYTEFLLTLPIVLEHGAEADRTRALSLLLESLHLYGTDAQALKSVEKAIKCGSSEVLDKIVNRLCEPGSSKRRAMLVDLALNGVGSQLIALILPSVNKDQGTTLYDAVGSVHKYTRNELLTFFCYIIDQEARCYS